MAIPKPNFRGFIKRDKDAMRIYLGLGIILIAIGATLLIVGFGDLTVKIGSGLVVSAITTLPIKGYIARKDRITGVQLIEERWNQITTSPKVPKAELEKLYDLTWKLYEQGGLTAA